MGVHASHLRDVPDIDAVLACDGYQLRFGAGGEQGQALLHALLQQHLSRRGEAQRAGGQVVYGSGEV